MWQWLENIWNLRKIFDKYLPMLREAYTNYQELKRLPAVVGSLMKENEALRYRLTEAESRIKTLELKNDPGVEIL